MKSVIAVSISLFQAVNRWMMLKESGVSGPDKGPLRNDILQNMFHLKSQITVCNILLIKFN